jgi:hypothetical protein
VAVRDIGLTKNSASRRKMIAKSIDSGLAHLHSPLVKIRFQLIFAFEKVLGDASGVSGIVVIQGEYACADEARDSQHFFNVVCKPTIKGIDDVTLDC